MRNRFLKVLSALALLLVIFAGAVTLSGVPILKDTPTDLQEPLSLLSKVDLLKRSTGKQVFVFGSSTVLGKALRKSGDILWRKHTIPAFLQNEMGSQYSVQNLGFDGALPQDMYELSRKLEDYRPAAVCIGVNLRLFSRDTDGPNVGLSRPWLANFTMTKDGHVLDLGYRTRGLLKLEDFLDRSLASFYTPFRYRSSLQLALFSEFPQVLFSDLADRSIRSGGGADDNSMILLLKQKAKFASVNLTQNRYQVQALKNLIRFWQSKGVPVTVFHSQDNPEILADVADPKKYKDDLAALTSIVEGEGAEFVSTENLSLAGEFIDTTHLNAAGNLRVAKLLALSVPHQIPKSGLKTLTELPTIMPESKETSYGLLSVTFFVFLLILLSWSQFSRSSAGRHGLYVILSFIWLLSFQWTPISTMLLLVFLIMGYLLPKGFICGFIPKNNSILTIGIVFQTVIFILLNQYFWEQGPWNVIFPNSPLIRVLGISYIFFRSIHLMVDAKSGDLKNLNPILFLSYAIGFLTLLAGPIAKFQDYKENWEDGKVPDQGSILDPMIRIALGFFKKLVLASFVHECISLAPGLKAAADAQIIFYFYGYALYVYLDFSGYTDIVVGSGKLIGLTLPENFDFPFLSSEPSLIWKRWHISFTDWLLTYLFNPIMKVLTKRTRGKRPLLVFSISYFFVFFLAGLWHGTFPIILWGLVTAFTIVAIKMGEYYLKKTIGKERFLALSKMPAATVFGIVFTFHFICYSFSLIGLKTEELILYHERLLHLLF